MLIEELINKLQKMMDKNGNVPIFLWDYTNGNREFAFEGNAWVDWEFANSECNRIYLRIKPNKSK